MIRKTRMMKRKKLTVTGVSYVLDEQWSSGAPWGFDVLNQQCWVERMVEKKMLVSYVLKEQWSAGAQWWSDVIQPHRWVHPLWSERLCQIS